MGIAAPPPPRTVTPADSVLDRFFESYYRLRPVNATFTGLHDHDHRLPDWSPDGLRDAVGEMRQLLSDLERRPTADDDDIDLTKGFLEIQIAEIEGTHFQRGNPALYTGEAAFGVISLLLPASRPAASRVDALENRLRAVPRFLSDGQTTLADATIPPAWIARARGECTGIIRLCQEGITAWGKTQGLTAGSQERLGAAAGSAAEAARAFDTWLGDRGTPNAHGGCGPDLFDRLLRQGHCTDRTRDQLLAEARDQLPTAEARRDELVRAAGCESWADASARLAADRPDPSGYLEAFRTRWAACRERAEQHDLLTWPDFPLEYRPIPPWAQAAAPHLYFLSYRSPPPLDPPPVIPYWVPPMIGGAAAPLAPVAHSVITLNHVVHHGAVGHHVQNHYAYRAPSRIGRIAAVDCASRIGMFCGGSMAEGWACYATDLMDEVGFYSPLEVAAQQYSRVRQLCRAVVDIELHQHTMDADTATRFLQEHLGLDATAAHNEITKVTMFPGTAMMYWFGTETLWQLRRRCETAAPHLSLRDFHDRVLSHGSIPVALIAKRVMAHLSAAQ